MRFESLQRIGRALMLPIAVLPLAGLLLRLGQPDLLAIPFVSAAGEALFANLGLLFAAGVAIGFARDGNGTAALAGIVCFLVLTEGAKALLAAPPGMAGPAAVQAWRETAMNKLSVPVGMMSGIASGLLYNRFHAIKVPEYLAFFGGRRFVPLAAGITGLAGAFLLGLGLPFIEAAVDGLSAWILRSGSVGLFVYGLANRVLLVTGLHHILNNMAWFVVGDFHGASGDLKRFFAGDPTAGGFMAGFFPVMMFGLPAACLAMYRAVPAERRARVGGFFLSLALTSFLTGVTEPIEFAFLFLAPLLFVFHAVMTGIAMVLMDALGIRLGFTFSAGFADFAINFGLSTRPWLLLPIGLAYGFIYYWVFSLAIRRLNLATPGREGAGDDSALATGAAAPLDGGRAAAMAQALGGRANIIELEACMTRLRLVLADPALADEAALRGLGARGIVRPGGKSLQVILGPQADLVATELRQWLNGGAGRAELGQARSAPGDHPMLAQVISAFGGPANVLAHETCGNRILLTLQEEPAAFPAELLAGFRGVVRCGEGRIQIVMQPGSEGQMQAEHVH